MDVTWGDIFKEFGKKTGIPYDLIADYRPCVPPYYDVEIPHTIVVWLKNGGTILYTPKRTIFEVGKCYEHPDGMKMRIIAEVNTYFKGLGLLAETNGAEYIIVKRDSINNSRWTECDDFAKE